MTNSLPISQEVIDILNTVCCKSDKHQPFTQEQVKLVGTEINASDCKHAMAIWSLAQGNVKFLFAVHPYVEKTMVALAQSLPDKWAQEDEGERSKEHKEWRENVLVIEAAVRDK